MSVDMEVSKVEIHEEIHRRVADLKKTIFHYESQSDDPGLGVWFRNYAKAKVKKYHKQIEELEDQLTT